MKITIILENENNENVLVHEALTIQDAINCLESFSNLFPKCEVSGCHELAKYEGWHRPKDPFGYETGIIQRRQVCESHKSLLIGKTVVED